MDLETQAAALAALRAAVRAGGLPSVHDISEGGLACALAECCIAGGIGARVDLAAVAGEHDQARLFGEGPGGVLVAGPRELIERLPGAVELGVTGGDRLQIDGLLDLDVPSLKERFEGAIPAAFA